MGVRLILVAVLCAFAVPAAAAKGKKAKPVKGDKSADDKGKTVTAPAKGSPHEAIIQGLKLVKSGDYDKWVEGWCHKAKLCTSDHAIRSVSDFNLKALNKKLNEGECLSGKDDTITVTRTDGKAEDGKMKIFIRCSETSSPRPFSLEKEGGGWRFTKI